MSTTVLSTHKDFSLPNIMFEDRESKTHEVEIGGLLWPEQTQQIQQPTLPLLNSPFNRASVGIFFGLSEVDGPFLQPTLS